MSIEIESPVEALNIRRIVAALYDTTARDNLVELCNTQFIQGTPSSNLPMHPMDYRDALVSLTKFINLQSSSKYKLQEHFTYYPIAVKDKGKWKDTEAFSCVVGQWKGPVNSFVSVSQGL